MYFPQIFCRQNMCFPQNVVGFEQNNCSSRDKNPHKTVQSIVPKNLTLDNPTHRLQGTIPPLIAVAVHFGIRQTKRFQLVTIDGR